MSRSKRSILIGAVISAVIGAGVLCVLALLFLSRGSRLPEYTSRHTKPAPQGSADTNGPPLVTEPANQSATFVKPEIELSAPEPEELLQIKLHDPNVYFHVMNRVRNGAPQSQEPVLSQDDVRQQALVRIHDRLLKLLPKK